MRSKITYTGYLRRELPTAQSSPDLEAFVQEPYILVTAGGGGDGEEIVDWVLRAYEADDTLPARALVVFGPFMQPERQKDFRERADRLKRVRAITFDAHVEGLIDGAEGIVAMGGYNTFCEILSFDKRALIVPRTRPRMEQYIRASKAEALGLVRMLANNGRRDTRRMVRALRDLATQPKPSEVDLPGLLGGLDRVNALVSPWLRSRRDTAPQYARARV